MLEVNKIYNVDAYKAIKELENKSIDCIYTDIPYLYANGGGGSSPLSQAIAKKINFIKNISSGIDYSILDEFIRVLKKVNLYIWCSKAQILDLLTYFKEYYFEILVWCKTNPQPACNNTWLPDIEYCLYFREASVKLNDGYNLKFKHYIEPINQKDKVLYLHPTIKPLELVKRHLLHTTKENDIILDPFVGSGTTAIACKQTNRKFIGFELDKEYYRIACDRLCGLTQYEDKVSPKQMSIFDIR